MKLKSIIVAIILLFSVQCFAARLTVDNTCTDQGGTSKTGCMKSLINANGTTNPHELYFPAKIVAGTPYTVTTTIAIPANYTVTMDRGAYFSGAAVTAGTITNLKYVTPNMFGLNTIPGTTDMTVPIQAAFNAGITGEISFIPEDYKVTAKIYLGSLTGNEQKVKVTMPAGASIVSTVASDYTVQATNLGYSYVELNLRTPATGSGLNIKQNGTGNSLNNIFVVRSIGAGRAATKTAISAGTKGVKIDAPAVGYANYYNTVTNGYIESYDTCVEFDVGANGNHDINNTHSTYWYGSQVSSSNNTVTGGFYTNSEGSVGAGTSIAVRIGAGTSDIAAHNVVNVSAEPGGAGVYAKMVESDSYSTNNIIIVGNNTANPVYLDVQNTNNYIIDGYNGAQFNSLSAYGIGVNGLFLQRNLSEAPSGGFIGMQTSRQLLTMTASATVDTTSISIPAGATILGASLVNAAAMSVTYNAAFVTGATNSLTPGGAVAVNKDTKTNTMIAPTVTSAVTQIRFTATSGSFTTGDKVNIVVYYMYLSGLNNTP